jgi:hypothetical protein
VSLKSVLQACWCAGLHVPSLSLFLLSLPLSNTTSHPVPPSSSPPLPPFFLRSYSEKPLPAIWMPETIVNKLGPEYLTA